MTLVALIGLNIIKYRSSDKEVLPVWSSYDQEYYNEETRLGLWDGVKKTFSPENLLYQATKIRVRAPITYLKQEIPLLAYYTPEDLKEPTQTIYNPGNSKNNIIQLKFDLSKENIQDKNPIIKETEDYPADNNIEIRKNNNAPLVVIYHTHTSETYIDDPRPQDNNGHVMPGQIGNVGKVGMELASVLSEKYGFRVVHTTRVHDQSYSRSYYNSRQTVKDYLNQYSDIDLILDIHRDGIKKASSDAVTTVINGQRVAKVMIVVTNGKFDFAHLDLEDHHQEWQRNLTLADKLADKIKQMYPGILNRIEIRDTTYNQDLHPHALLLEIGDYRNTTTEAIRSAGLIANVIASLYRE